MHLMNQPKLALTIPRPSDEGDDPIADDVGSRCSLSFRPRHHAADAAQHFKTKTDRCPNYRRI